MNDDPKADKNRGFVTTPSVRRVVQTGSSRRHASPQSSADPKVDTAKPAAPNNEQTAPPKVAPQAEAPKQEPKTSELKLNPALDENKPAKTPTEEPKVEKPPKPKKQPKPKKPYDRAYLPAAEELEATPAPAASRWFAFVICAFMIGLVGWAYWGHVDIVIVAQGRTVSQDRAQKVQSEAGGTVRQIYVRDGDRVTEGQVLVEFDPTVSKADIFDVELERDAALLDVSYYRALQQAADEQAESPTRWFKPTAEHLSGESIDLTHDKLNEFYNRYLETLHNFASQQRERQAALRTAKAEITRVHEVRPFYVERLAAFKKLADKGFTARRNLDGLEIEIANLDNQEKVAFARIDEVEAGISALTQAEATYVAEQRANWADGLIKARLIVDKATSRLTVLERDNYIREVRAPKSGQVQERAVNTVGGVVGPGEVLMLIAPETFDLHVEAAILNKDVGLITEGMAAEIKLEAFPFTRHGSLEGELVRVALDASEREGIGAFYAAKLTLDQTHINIEGKPIKLAPGMSATVEIKTGTRRIIDYIISPLLRYRDEAGRER